MGRKLSEILKDRKIFSEQQEKRIHENALKEAGLVSNKTISELNEELTKYIQQDKN